MAYDSKVVIKILGDATNFNNVINSTEASIKSLKGLLAKLGLATSVGAVAKEVVSNTTALETEVAKASTLFGDVSVNVDQFKTKIMELSKETGRSASSIASAVYQAESSGVEVTESMDTMMSFMETATKLSVAGFTSVENAVDSLAKIQNAYGKDVLNVDQISKNLVMTQNLGITTVEQLSQSLANVTPTASAFGVSLENIGASLSVMTKAGTDTAKATTQLNSLISSLAKSDTDASKALKKATKEVLGQEKSFSDLIKEGKNLQEILGYMKTYADNAGVSIVDLFTEMNAGKGALQLVSDSTGTFNEYLQQMQSEADIVQETYDKVMDTRAQSWSKLANRLKNITIKVGMSASSQKLLDDLTKTAENLLDKIESWLPNMIASLNKFYYQAKLVFAYLEGEYDRSFLKKGVDFVINVVKDELDDLKKKFESGDIFGTALQLIGDLITIKVSFKLLTGLGAVVLNSFTKTFGGKAGALMLVGDALMVYVGFKDAQKDGDWETFGLALVAGILAGVATAGLTGSLSAGLLFFGIAFKLAESGELEKGLEKMAESVLKVMKWYAKSLDAWNAMFGIETHYADSIVTVEEAKAIEEEIKKQEELVTLRQQEKEELEKTIEAKKEALKVSLEYLEKVGAIENKTIKKQDLPLVNNMTQRVSQGVSPENAYQDYIKGEKVYLQQIEDDMVSTAETALQAIRNELVSLWDTDVGRNAILGIYDGFSKEELENIGEEAGRNLLDAVKNELGIHSPSEEFKKIGEFCIQGLAEGMTKSNAKEKLDTAFDQIYKSMQQAVKDGTMSLEEAFAELQEMLTLSSEYVSKIESYVSQVNTTQPQRRTTGGGGVNSIEGWTLDENGKWVEKTKSAWQKMLDWLKGACSDVSNWLFSDLGVKDKDGNPLTDENGDLVEFGKTGLDLVNEIYGSISSLSGYLTDTIINGLDSQISALEEARDSAKKYNELSIEDEKAYDAKIKALKKEKFEKEKRANIATAVMDGALAIMNIIKEWSGNLPMIIALSALAGATTGAQIASIASQSSGYERGGLIGGHGYTGDKQQIWANAGELILNRAQQRTIADQLSYGGNTTVIQVDFSGNVFGDQQTIAEYVYDAIKTAQSQGAIRAW